MLIRRNAMRVLFIDGTAEFSQKQLCNSCATAQSSDQHVPAVRLARTIAQ